jgi:hypothetical protein
VKLKSKHYKFISGGVVILLALVLVVGFQNCGQKVDFTAGKGGGGNTGGGGGAGGAAATSPTPSDGTGSTGSPATPTPVPFDPGGLSAGLPFVEVTTNIAPCLPSGVGVDYQVGPGVGQLSTLEQVPWESLKAGDTVRIFYKTDPYRGKILLVGVGTSSAPIRVCGVKGPYGERPIVDGENAIARKNPTAGPLYTSATYDKGDGTQNIQESRTIVMIDRLGTGDWNDYPAYLQLDGLEIRGATSAYKFTNSFGGVQPYDDFGACVWVNRGKHVVIADNVIHDCTNGIYSKSTEDAGDNTITSDLKIIGNSISNCGVVNDVHEHNLYIQSVGVVVEFNYSGPLRSGALGNVYKDRSVGSIVRFNRFEGGAHSLDFVEAEDYAPTAMNNPNYRTTVVYGNQIIKDGSTGSFIHYGGDHYGGVPGGKWGESLFRQGTLYFFNNTVYVSGSSWAGLFQLSTTLERAEVWNNVFAFADSVVDRTFRTSSEVNATYWTPGGVVNLGKNWTNITCKYTNCPDSDEWHTVPGSLLGKSNLVYAASIGISIRTLMPIAGATMIDAAQANLPAVSEFLVNYQLNSNRVAAPRAILGAKADMGAFELK